MAHITVEDGARSTLTQSDGRLVTESFVSESEFKRKGNVPADVEFDPICPIPFNKYRAEKMLPGNHLFVQSIDIESHAGGQMDESSGSSEDEFDQIIRKTAPHGKQKFAP